MHFDKRVGEGKQKKGICAVFRCCCQFSMGMVCCTRIAINYGYVIAIRRVFREPFEPSASG